MTKLLSKTYRIVARREQIREQTGTQPASINLIRQLREGSKRNDFLLMELEGE